MKDNLRVEGEFAQKIKNIKDIVQIVLFGSVATGQDTITSDIDIAIVHRAEDQYSLATLVNRAKPEKVQTTLIHADNLWKETELTGALSGEGILLYGRPILIQYNKLEFHAKVLLSYSLRKMPQKEKVKLNRALYGSSSKSQYKGKKYETRTFGLVREPGIEKISDSVLLVAREKSAKLIAVLKRFGAETKQIPLWGY